MLPDELVSLVERIQAQLGEAQNVEVKAAHEGCPKRLYDTLSSFSNQDDGGVIVFGLDEGRDYALAGVYDVHDLQKHVVEQCNQMEPPVCAVFTAAAIGDAHVVAAEIPGIDVAERPCYYQGKGRLKGSYVRVGEADEPMTEYEVYSYEAFRKKLHDEEAPVPRATRLTLNEPALSRYLLEAKAARPNLSQLDDAAVLELKGLARGGEPTLAAVMLFSLYPQAFFPQLAIVATSVPGMEAGAVDDEGNRFLDNRRIEGTLGEQLAGALAFARANMRIATRIDPATGEREDRPDYPVEAVRELVLNALVHRDYSSHTQGMPIQLTFYQDRLEIINPGGLYGRLSIDDLGKARGDTRNPVIATTMEELGETENRYSGIPTVRRLLREAGMEEPRFESSRGQFRAVLFRGTTGGGKAPGLTATQRRIAEYCASEPRSRAEIAKMLGVQSGYAMRRHVNPMVEAGMLRLSKPDAPQSRYQRFMTTPGLLGRSS